MEKRKRRKQKRSRLSNADREMLRLIENDPMVSEYQMSRMLRTSEDAVRRRFRRIKSKGFACWVPCVARAASLFTHRAVVGVGIDQKKVGMAPEKLCSYMVNAFPFKKKWRAIEKEHSFGLCRVETAFSVLGAFDMITVIASTSSPLTTDIIDKIFAYTEWITRTVSFSVTADDGAHRFPRSKLAKSFFKRQAPK
jgi:DNA-binding Lrp family transcriptional regulator